MLSTINGKKDCLEIIQRYRLPMFVNHAMDQLSHAKDNHVLMEWESMSDVMREDFVTVQESGSGYLDIVNTNCKELLPKILSFRFYFSNFTEGLHKPQHFYMHFQPSNLLILRNKVMAQYLCCLFYNKCLGMLQRVILENENKLCSSSFL